MRAESNESKLEQFGLKFTKIYLIFLFGTIPVFSYFGLIELQPLQLNEIGDFLAGAFGPLAIFWLVLGFFQQGRELRYSVEALNLQAEELKHSVEQQKAMVEITKDQLQLDIEVREDQTAMARSKELPYFQLSGGGHSGVSGSNFRNYILHLKNVGPTCIEGKAIITLNDDEELNVSPLGYLETGRDKRTDYQAHPDVVGDPNSKIIVTVKSTSIRGQDRTQVFKIENGTPKMISCSPEVI